MVIDTGVFPHKDFKSKIIDHPSYDEDYIDDHGHGTHVTGIIMKDVCENVKLISCKYWIANDKTGKQMERLYHCLKRAKKEKVDFINYSSSGNELDETEYDLIEELSQNGTKIVVSAGNDNRNLQKTPAFPAMYDIKEMVVVGSLKKDNKTRLPNSNYGKSKMKWEIGEEIKSTDIKDTYSVMTGTSQATAFHTNKLIKLKCKEILKWQPH